MLMLTALSFLAVSGVALFLCYYFFIRFMGDDDTEYFAEVMRQIRESDAPARARNTRGAKAA